MQQYLLTFRHYFRRSIEPIGIAILTGLPVVIITILNMVFSQNAEQNIYYNGYNMVSTKISTVMMIMFQFVGGNIILDYLYTDFRTAKRWRLLSVPCHVHVFIFSAALASMVFSVIQGFIIVMVTHFFMDVYWGNNLVLIAVIILSALISHLIHMIIFLLTNKKGVAEGMSQIFVWGMSVISGTIIPIPDNVIPDFIKNYATPFSLSINAIEQSGFMNQNFNNVFICLSVLVTISILLVITVILLGRRRSF